jgi:hypothetical protein
MWVEGLWKNRLFHWGRTRGTASQPIQIDFDPQLAITNADSLGSLDLQLVNRSNVTVWVEEATIVLTDLEADSQASLATGREKHKIRQPVGAHFTLSMSLAGAVYEAAGRPQGSYECVIVSNVRYRTGELWVEKPLLTYRLKMVALSAMALRKMRWFDRQFPSTNC